MTYRPNDDEAAVALTVARRRNSLNGGGSNIPGGETATEDERLKQHYRGALAEIAVSRVFNLCWTGCGKGASGLHDVGGWLEVRSIGDMDKGLLARPRDRNADPVVLVFVDIPSRRCYLLGWTYFGVAKKEGFQLAVGTPKMCWIYPRVKLLPMSSLQRAGPVYGL